jgi:galactose mutarotase-like enzyme
MIELRNNIVCAKINRQGAELQEFQKLAGENVIWRKNDSHWNRFAPILFPIVGRLKNDMYIFNGNSYRMKQHGFARDCQFEIIDQANDHVSLRLQANSFTAEQYPFDFELWQCFELIGYKLKISSVVKNCSEKKLLYSIGGHPGFHLADDLSNYYLDFGKNIRVEQYLIEGNYYSGKTQPLHLSQTFCLANNLFEEDAIVVKPVPINHIRFCHKTLGEILTLSCDDWTAFGLWTKIGAPFFCIEPWWGWADDLISDGQLEKKNGILTLDSFGERTHSFTIQLPV